MSPMLFPQSPRPARVPRPAHVPPRPARVPLVLPMSPRYAHILLVLPMSSCHARSPPCHSRSF